VLALGKESRNPASMRVRGLDKFRNENVRAQNRRRQWLQLWHFIRKSGEPMAFARWMHRCTSYLHRLVVSELSDSAPTRTFFFLPSDVRVKGGSGRERRMGEVASWVPFEIFKWKFFYPPVICSHMQVYVAYTAIGCKVDETCYRPEYGFPIFD
jgi:hypothetical protein